MCLCGSSTKDTPTLVRFWCKYGDRVRRQWEETVCMGVCAYVHVHIENGLCVCRMGA